MSQELKKVAIVNGICVNNDAISASVRDDAHAFSREHGFETKVFVYDNKLPDICAVVVRNVNDIIFHPFFVSADIIIYHFGVFYELFNAIFVGNGRAPQIVRYHNLTPRELLPRAEWPIADRSRQQLWNLAIATAVWPVSDINYQEIIDGSFGAPGKVEMIPLCVGDGIRRRSLADKNFDVVRLLYVGRFVRSKGITDLIQAVASLNEADLPIQLRLVGEQRFSHPEYVESLKTLAAGLDLEGDVAFIGGASDEALIAEYDAAHIFVMPSYHEGFCKPVIEAMRSGCICVSYDAFNLRYVTRGLSRTAPTGNVVALTARIAEAMQVILQRRDGAQGGLIPTDAGALSIDDYDARADKVLAEYGFPSVSERLRNSALRLLG